MAINKTLSPSVKSPVLRIGHTSHATVRIIALFTDKYTAKRITVRKIARFTDSYDTIHQAVRKIACFADREAIRKAALEI